MRRCYPRPVCWVVVSPTYWVTEPILDDGSGPGEPASDFVYVFSRSAVRAKVLAVRAWRRLKRMRWCGGLPKALRYYRVGEWLDEGENPFRGVRVLRSPLFAPPWNKRLTGDWSL